MKINSETFSPQVKKVMSNEVQTWKNLTTESEYAILPNGGIINVRQWIAYSFTAGVAYATSGYIALGLSDSSSTPTPNEIEVMVLTQELKQLAQDLRDLGNKFDGKMDNFDNNFDLKLDKIDAKMDSYNKDLETKFDKLEAKIDKAYDKLTDISNKLSDKVTAVNTDVVKINTKMDINNTWKEKFQIPLIVALIVVIANHLPAIIKLFTGAP